MTNFATKDHIDDVQHTQDTIINSTDSQMSENRVLELKLEALGQVMNQTQSRLGELELVSKRPELAHQHASAPHSHASQHYKMAFLNYVRKGQDLDLQSLEQKALSVHHDPDGGYLVPDAMGQVLAHSMETATSFRSLARVMTISTDAVEILLDRDDADAGWVSETDERDETKTPELAKLRIAVHEMYAKPRATQKLLDDARIDVESWLVQKVTEKMASIENLAFLYGDGRNQPRGILNYPSTKAGNLQWGHIETFVSGMPGALKSPEALFSMFYAMKSEYRPNACWMMSRASLDLLRRMQDPASGHYLWQPQLSLGQPSTLMGHPVVLLDQLPNPSADETKPVILFANLQAGYQIVDRAGIRVLRDPYSAKPYVEFYTTRRVGGDVINAEAIKALALTH